MSSYIKTESCLLLRALVLGMIWMLVYTALEFLKKKSGKHPVLHSCSDFLYWLITGSVLFCEIYRYNQGIFRWFMLVGAVSGAFFVNFSLNLVKRLLFPGERCKISTYKLTEDRTEADNHRIPYFRRGRRIEKVKKKEK